MEILVQVKTKKEKFELSSWRENTVHHEWGVRVK